MTSDTTPDSDRSSTSRRRFLLGGAAVAGALAVPTAGVLGSPGETRLRTQAVMDFRVRIENVSDGTTLETTQNEQPVPLSPGAYAVHTADEPIFSHGEPERNNGLEEIAEDGSPGRLAAALAERDTVVDSGAFTTPAGADGPGPLLPGNAYEFTVAASPGKPTHFLSFATMFVPSNDLVFAPAPGGLQLFDGNSPMVGNRTDELMLWDAGTEINEEPGVGENQVQRQRGAGVGLVERGTVVPIREVNGYDYPDVSDVIQLTVRPANRGNGN